MPRGGRYLYAHPFMPIFRSPAGILDIIIIILVIFLLIKLFIVASVYVIALVALLVLREFVNPRYGRKW